jgi:hypothetical protein
MNNSSQPIGFSTGALAKGEVRTGIDLQRPFHVEAVELSALRDHELVPLIDAIETLDLSGFTHVSLHAPSSLRTITEQDLVSVLNQVPSDWPIVVHPDVIIDPENWRFFGRRLCIENMDQRKATGRTVPEMKAVFDRLPDASFCFDIGHARQIDPTMGVAINLLERFRERLRQVHMSEVDPYSKHIPIGFAALCGFQVVAKLIPDDCAVIIESIVTPDQIEKELQSVRRALTPTRSPGGVQPRARRYSVGSQAVFVSRTKNFCPWKSSWFLSIPWMEWRSLRMMATRACIRVLPRCCSFS